MSAAFWLATIVMTVLAFAFLAIPLVKTGRQNLVIATGFIVPVFAAILYLYLGSPGTASHASTAAPAMSGTAASSGAGAGQKVGSVSSMVDGLAERLRENPDDGKGWLLLARSYKHLNRQQEAAAAYARAAALGEHAGEFENQADTGAPPPPSGARISGKVTLSPEAADIVQPTDTVFIFARPAGGPGAPAAVLQRKVSDLPLDFTLDDTQSMVDGIKLSNFREVVVTARISRSGNATEALQGLEARTGPVSIGDQLPVQLTIE